jgi:7,8-dihydropterin-6-yl-methyl-4-(beta-D-ribofuranosyl)aminobenzene 5'-phosphate synthase
LGQGQVEGASGLTKKSQLAKITVLVDNQAGAGLTPEHGLSFWVETMGRRILFDTGQGTALPKNAQRLGIGLEEADVLVLSHGHYDHTGGVAHALKRAREMEVYCHPAVVQPRYSMRDGTARSIQMPRKSMVALESLPARRLHWVSRATMLSESVGVSGPIPRETSYEDTGGPFFLDPKGGRADPIEDDMALWISTSKGLVVCVGCCHAGLVNTLSYVCRLTGVATVRAVIGGFHLLYANAHRLEKTAAALRDFSPEIVAPHHCTGEGAVQSLKNALGERVCPGRSGLTYRF